MRPFTVIEQTQIVNAANAAIAQNKANRARAMANRARRQKPNITTRGLVYGLFVAVLLITIGLAIGKFIFTAI